MTVEFAFSPSIAPRHSTHSTMPGSVRSDPNLIELVTTRAWHACCSPAPAAFTAGMDLKSSGTGLAEGEEPGFLPFARALLAFDKPLLAAVNGIAVGIGTTVLLHCDIVLAAPSARFRVPFTRLGVVPEAASSLLLPAAIGWQAAAEWLYTSDWLHAEQAAALGFVLRVVPDAELMTQALHLAQRIAAMPITRCAKRNA